MDYSFLPADDRKSLRIRIEHIDNILNDLKKSHVLNQDSSSRKILAENTNKEEIDDLHISIKREVFGRDKEREHICSILRKGSDADGPSSSSGIPYSVIGIHGVTGSGKSTLAQCVCDHEKKAKHFDLIMFSHVSTTFRVDKIFLDMLEQITEVRPSDTERLKHSHKVPGSTGSRNGVEGRGSSLYKIVVRRGYTSVER